MRTSPRQQRGFAVWAVVAAVGAATVALKAVGPVFLAGRELPTRVAAVVGLLAPVLAALVVTSTAGDAKRVLGVAAAALAVLLRAPMLLVVVVAPIVSAGARALG